MGERGIASHLLLEVCKGVAIEAFDRLEKVARRVRVGRAHRLRATILQRELCPHLLVHSYQQPVGDLERLRGQNEAEGAQLLTEQRTADAELGDVCTVETIDAIRANDAALQRARSAAITCALAGWCGGRSRRACLIEGQRTAVRVVGRGLLLLLLHVMQCVGMGSRR